ncbi:putative diphthine synthase [Hordeum vulgare]|nr:putative diphthine synthase [Hordeum vulgare]
MYGKEITVADREMVEERADQMLSEATEADVGLGLPWMHDPVFVHAIVAITHTDLVVRVKNMGVEVKVIHNASVMNAIAVRDDGEEFMAGRRGVTLTRRRR